MMTGRGVLVGGRCVMDHHLEIHPACLCLAGFLMPISQLPRRHHRAVHVQVFVGTSAAVCHAA